MIAEVDNLIDAHHPRLVWNYYSMNVKCSRNTFN